MSATTTTLLWAAWVAGIGALAALAAYVIEPVARALRWPTRWLWTIALGAQLGAVLVATTTPDAARPAAWFVGVWVVASLAACLVYLRAVRVLHRERGSWRVTIAEAMPVWVSERTGPAVVGFVRSIVVAPAWAMALADRDRRLLLRHEAEHVSAWDPTLLLAGLATCALVPWSPATWWALARLRLAIEVDCDRRVLAAEPDVAAYGELLVAVQGRVVPGAAGIAAFAERRLPLEERLEAMTARRPRGAAWRWSMRGAVAATLVLAACMAPRPTTTSLSGRIDITADHLQVDRNADGSQTIRAKNATITARPDTARPALVAPIVVDSGLYASLRRTLDSVQRSGSAERMLEELQGALHPPTNAGDAARLEYEQGRGNALAFSTLREHFHRSDVARPLPGHIALFVLDDEGAILRRRDVDVRDSVDRISLGTGDLHRFFPDLPATMFAENMGVTGDEAFDLDPTSSVAWWMVGHPPRSTRGEATVDDSAFARWHRRALDAASDYVRRQRLDTLGAPITIRVLFASDWSVRGVQHGPYVPDLTAESVAAAFAGTSGAGLLRGGVTSAIGELGLPKGSEIGWAQLAPPRVIRVEPKKKR